METKKELSCQLGETELVERGRRLVVGIRRVRQLEEKLRMYRQKNGERREKIETRLETLRDAIEARAETRWVDCDIRVDCGETVVTRMDTGEIVERRAATADEMQAELPMVGHTRARRV